MSAELQYLRAARDLYPRGSEMRKLYKAAIRAIREGDDITSDLDDAWDYVGTTTADPSTMEESDFVGAWIVLRDQVVNVATEATWNEAGDEDCRAVRNWLRAMLTAPTSPDRIKILAEQWKRTNLLDTNAQGELQVDKQGTDPIKVAYDAQLLAPAPTTPEEFAVMADLLDRYRELTPKS